MSDNTCLRNFSTQMCQNCATYAGDMVKMRYNKIVKAMLDDHGRFVVARAEKFEQIFLKELKKKKGAVDNLWRIDQNLHFHLKRKILYEKEILLDAMTNSAQAVGSHLDITCTREQNAGQPYETISTTPDRWGCRRYLNHCLYYELPLEEDTVIEEIFHEAEF